MTRLTTPTFRSSLLLSATALFAVGCTALPYDETATPGNPSYGEHTTVNPEYVPEAPPVDIAQGNPPTYHPQPSHPPTKQCWHGRNAQGECNPRPGSTRPAQPQPQPQPQPPAQTYVPTPQTPAPSQQNDYGSNGQSSYDQYDTTYVDNSTDNGGYDYYDTSNAPTNQGSGSSSSGGIYDYSGGSASSGSDHYGGGDSYTGSDNYYAGANDSSSSSNYGAAGSTGSSGGAAVQVFASGSRSNAEQVRRRMSSRGLSAVVDNVDGLYKVRIPFNSESEARRRLASIRSQSGERGAFITFR